MVANIAFRQRPRGDSHFSFVVEQDCVALLATIVPLRPRSVPVLVSPPPRIMGSSILHPTHAVTAGGRGLSFSHSFPRGRLCEFAVWASRFV